VTPSDRLCHRHRFARYRFPLSAHIQMLKGMSHTLTLARAPHQSLLGNLPREVVMSAEVAAKETKGPGIVLQPEEGQSC
jgi:hypothetical protein